MEVVLKLGNVFKLEFAAFDLAVESRGHFEIINALFNLPFR